MANLVNPTPLNVPPVAQASAPPTPVPPLPPTLEVKTAQTAVPGFTAGPRGHATPHSVPPATAGIVAQKKG